MSLNGIRVVEFCHMIMGPTCGMILGDLGADVIKVEPLNGDATRRLRDDGAGFFPAYNRNKRSITLDLKSSDGLQAAKRLAIGADVIIENFRPGTLERLGLGYKELSKKNAGLIYCSLKGFLEGPYENRTALDEVVQMMAGLAYMTGPEGRPLRAGASVIDIMGGMWGVIGIQAALANRAVTGKGQEVTAALYETTVHAVAQHMSQFAVTGAPSIPMPESQRAWAVYDIFTTKDSKQLFIGIVSDKQWRLFCEEFKREDLLNNPSLATNNQRSAAREHLKPVLEKLFSSLSQEGLMAICERIGLPFAPITKPHELFDDPHLNQSGNLLDITLPNGKGKAQVPGLPLTLGGLRTEIRYDLPELGEHSREILEELGYSKIQIDDLIAS
ncbi:MAG: CoA transferase [Alphaproteobacteria bacterium TMED93]|nr:MAG: CoA transferase [Alphaproteobacteria bacterium TMED93]